MSTVIKVENLSKKYIISHHKRARYTALRDVIATKCKNISYKLRHPLTTNNFKNGTREEFWALTDINFTIRQGDRLGIIGKNGAGKSTLLKLLSRITEPTTGRMTIEGRIASLLEVGTGFHPELTGRENIFLNGAVLGMGKAEIKSKFDEIVDFSGVEKFLDTPVKRYSSGMYVRLAFAVAAHLEPEILLVDEVLAVGDAEFQKKCLGKMEEVGKEGRTILFVSHNMTAVSGLCTKAICLDQGKMNYSGDVQNAISKYLISGDTNDSSVDLTQKKDRSGPSEFSRLLHVTLKNQDGRPNNTFKIFGPMSVEISFLLKEETNNLEIGFGIISSLNEPIAGYVSTWEGLNPSFRQGKHHILCVIPHLHLLPNNYHLTIWIKKVGNKVDEQVNRAISFIVVGDDVTGHTPYFERYKHLKTFSRSSWSVKQHV
ncbi:ABC transporter ATP-binding protein [Thermodesulfobacteriota bacterium]